MCRSRCEGLDPAQGQHQHGSGEPQRRAVAPDRASPRRISTPVASLDFHELHDRLVRALLPFVERRNLSTPIRGETSRFPHNLRRSLQQNAGTVRVVRDAWRTTRPTIRRPGPYDRMVATHVSPSARERRNRLAWAASSGWNDHCSRLLQMRFEDRTTSDLHPKVARCRLILSLIAIVAVYVDPTKPTGVPWLHLTGREFAIDPYALAVLSLHLAYSSCVCWVIARQLLSPQRLAAI